MSATITLKTATGDGRSLAVAAGEALWLSDAGERAEPGAASLCVVATDAAVWAIVAPAADAVATSRGRPVMGGMIDLLEAPLTVGELTCTARADDHGPRRAGAPADCECPICRLPIQRAAEVFVCSCGVVTDSHFCATAGAPEDQCFACGAPRAGGTQG